MAERSGRIDVTPAVTAADERSATAPGNHALRRTREAGVLRTTEYLSILRYTVMLDQRSMLAARLLFQFAARRASIRRRRSASPIGIEALSRARNDSGKSATPIGRGGGVTKIASSRFFNSRTLPGHSYCSSAERVSSAKPGTARPRSRFSFRK